MSATLRNAAADHPMPPVGLNPSEDDACELAALIASSPRVLPWLQDWTCRVLAAFAKHGWSASPSSIDDEMTLGIDTDERSWCLGADIWDLASETSFRVTLELASYLSSSHAGITCVRIYVRGGPRLANGQLPLLRQEELLRCTSRPGSMSSGSDLTLGDWAEFVLQTLQAWSDSEARIGDEDFHAFAQDFDQDMRM